MEDLEGFHELTDSTIVRVTFKFPNGMVVTYATDEKQIPDLQGEHTKDLENKIKKYSNEKTVWKGY